jgi:hypothetical protein
MDRMAVHARLTARHLDLEPQDALPAMVVAALILAEQYGCTNRVSNRLKLFLAETGLATKEELEKWRE